MRVVYVTKAKHRDCSHTHRAINFKTFGHKKSRTIGDSYIALVI